MAEKVPAAVLVEPRHLELLEFPLPALSDDDALLEVEATGICGSDWAPYAGLWPRRLNGVVLGHEVIGRVAAIGPSPPPDGAWPKATGWSWRRRCPGGPVSCAARAATTSATTCTARRACATAWCAPTARRTCGAASPATSTSPRTPSCTP